MFTALKGLLFETSDGKDSTTTKNNTNMTQIPSMGSVIKIPETVSTTTDNVTTEQSIDKEIFETLSSSLEKNHYSGVGYLEFLRFFRSFDDIIQDEGTKVKSAMAAGKSIGLTQDSLLQSFDYYISVLKNEETKFLKIVDEKNVSEIASKKDGITNKDTELAAKREQIKAIEADIARLESEKTQLNQEVVREEQQINQVKENFYRTYKVVFNSITGDKERIIKYIGSSSKSE